MVAKILDPDELSLQGCTTGYHVPVELFLHYLNKHWSFLWDQQDSFLRNHPIKGRIPEYLVLLPFGAYISSQQLSS